MKNRVLILLFACPLLFFIIGCGNPSVKGKVTLQDGTPVTVGKVYFENGAFAATGTIQKDGSYKMGTTKEGNGIPPGKYKIAIMGAIINKFPEVTEPKKPAKLGGFEARGPIEFTNLVHPKYTSINTSGLEVEVKGSMKYDIVVEPPSK